MQKIQVSHSTVKQNGVDYDDGEVETANNCHLYGILRKPSRLDRRCGLEHELPSVLHHSRIDGATAAVAEGGSLCGEKRKRERYYTGSGVSSSRPNKVNVVLCVWTYYSGFVFRSIHLHLPIRVCACVPCFQRTMLFPPRSTFGWNRPFYFLHPMNCWALSGISAIL